VNLLGDDIETIKKNIQTLIDAGKEVDLEVNTEKIKFMFTGLLGSLDFPSSGILETRKHDVSETGSVSVLR
jgi:hypothetical protein